MITLDIRTILVLNIAGYLLCTLFIGQLWWQNRGRYSGPGFWSVNLSLQVAGLILIALRGMIPDWISIVLGNSLVLTGLVLNYIGLERFLGKPGTQVPNYVLLLAFALALALLTYVRPDFDLRSLVVATAMLVVSVQSVWLLWVRVEAGQRRLTFLTGLVFFAFCLLNLTRMAAYFVAPPAGNNYMNAGVFHALLLIGYQLLIMALAYGLVLMVNRRLIVDLSANQEKFVKAFHAAPYAMVFSDLSDGTIFDSNEAFNRITGYERVEVIGKKTVDLHLWEHDEDRSAIINRLAKDGSVQGYEMRYRKKSGELGVGDFYAETVSIEGRLSMLSCLADISLRKQAELALQESEARYRALVDRSPEAIGVHRHGKLIYVNPAAVRMFAAKSAQELMDKPVLELIHTDYRAMALARIQSQIETGVDAPMVEEKFIRLDGTVMDGETQGTTINYDGAAAILVAVRDNTERNRALDEMRRYSAELERFNRIMVGRELDMIALKQQVNALSNQLGQPAPF